MPAPDVAVPPIGIFDSGIGGLSVMRAVRARLPNADLMYVADSGYAPYGDRSPEQIRERTLRIGRWLERSGIGALTVACNTATAVAIEALRAIASVPVVAIEPAIKPAVVATHTGVVGVMATTRTIRSARVASLCEAFGGQARILLQACPGLAERVELADLEGARTRALLREFVEPLLEEGADTLVLGCTHYPFLTPVLRELFGPEIALIDPADAVARELARRIGLENCSGCGARPTGDLRFLTSGDPSRVGSVIRRLWPDPVHVERLPEA
jgi:glutamate racemase